MRLTNNLSLTKIFIRGVTTVVLIALLAGCSDDAVPTEDKIPSVESIEAAMKTMTPLGYAASMFMAAINVSNPANTQCTTDKFGVNLCVSSLEIPFDQPTQQSFPIPLESAGTAKMLVAGIWPDDPTNTAFKVAVISLLFVDMKGGSFGFPTYKISTIPVKQTDLGIITYYSSSDINVDKDAAIDSIKQEISGLSSTGLNSKIEQLGSLLSDISNTAELNLQKDYWIVKVEDTQQTPTPDNYFDDLYRLSGGGVYIDAGVTSGSAYQIGVADLVMGSDCKINPIAGKAMINELNIGDGDSSNWFSLGSVLLEFGPTCDGQAQVRFGLGSYGPITDERVPLYFAQN